MVCSRCHTSNFQHDRYCRECGTAIDSLGPAPASEDPEVEQLLRQAFERLERGEEEGALESMQGALALQPDSAAAHSGLGVIYERQGKLREALHQVELALQLNPRGAADRDRRLLLLAALGESPGRSGPPAARIALVSAVIAGFVVFGVGLSLVVFGRPGAEPDRVALGSGPAPSGVSGQEPFQTTGPGRLLPVPALSGAPNRPGLPVVVPTPAPPSRTLPAPPVRTGPLTGRIGLPPVVDYPQRAPGQGLPPAAIGEVVPLPPPAPPAGTPVPGEGTELPAADPAPARVAAEKPVEPFETETGFIKIEPVIRPASPGRIRPGAGSAGAPAPLRRPTLELQVTPVPAEASLLDDARRARRLADEAWKRRNADEAFRRFSQAARLFEAALQRGEGPAAEARQELDACRRALASLR